MFAIILCSLTSVGIVLGVGYWSGFINLPILEDFEILVSPSSLEYRIHQSSQITITLKSINGFDKPIQLSTENIPFQFIAVFGYLPDDTTIYTVTCPANEQTSIWLLLFKKENVGNPTPETYNFTIHGISGSLMHSKTVSLHIRERSYEKLEIVSAYAVKDTALGQWNVTMSVKNTGYTDATFDNVLINGQLGTDYTPAIADDATDVTVASGASVTVHVYIDTSLFEAATTVEINLHTATGLDYPLGISLP